jgi:DNA transformation protein
MAYDKQFAEYVMAQLGMVAPVRSQGMFGGVGVWSDDHFFALIANDSVYFKVSDANRADFEEAGMKPFQYGDPPTVISYWQVPTAVLDEPEELAIWVQKAVDVARFAKLKKKN